MDLPESALLEIWEMFSEHLPASKRNDLAVRFVDILVSNDVDLSDLGEIRGEDEHLDHAFELLEEEEGYDDESEHED